MRSNKVCTHAYLSGQNCKTMFCLLLFGFISYAVSFASDVDSYDTLHIYGSNDFPPYEFVDDNGKPAGFDVELMEVLMSELKLPYKIILTDWNSVTKAYHEGKADIILGISYSEKRAYLYKYGMSYASVYHDAVFRRGTGPYKRFDQLRGKKILVDKGDLLEEMLRENGLSKEIVVIKNLGDGLEMLSRGRADVLLCARDVALYFIEKRGITNLDTKDLESFPKDYGYAGNNTRVLAAMDRTLMKLKENGIYEQIYRRWFTDYNNTRVSHVIYLSVSGLIFFALIAYLFIYLLRRKVNAAKKMISSQNLQLALAIRAGNIYVWIYNKEKALFSRVSYNNEVSEIRTYEEELALFHLEDRVVLSNVIEDLLIGKEPPKRLCLRKISEDVDRCIYVELEFAQIRNKYGHIDSFIATSRDITHTIEIQHHLEEEKEKAQTADKLKSTFLANMSHEIRTPLNAIVGFSSLLCEDIAPEKRQKSISIINSNTELLLRLVNDILELSEIEAGVVRLQNIEFDFSLEFDKLVDTLKLRCTNSNVEINGINPYRECVISSDSDRLAQIVTNFAGNAIKYTLKGKITIGYRYEDESLYLYVEDTGTGIPKSQQHRIFKRFEKLNDFVQGTGLGLSICKAIVDSCNGDIGFSSEEGKGSIFWARIPCEVISIH